MPLQPPNLDDRDFERLFQEARARIPRYLPEWTDWNESDPGITLLQLQAWLAETILYRLNRLPDLNYIKFLQLLGMEQIPARPAQADLTFILKDEAKVGAAEVLIDRYTVVGVSAPDLEEPLAFETDRTLRAITAKLAKLVVISASGTRITAEDVTGVNQVDGQAFQPFGEGHVANGEERSLLIGFQSNLPFSREEIGLQVYLAEAGVALLASPEVTPCPPNGDADAPPQLEWHWWDGVRWDDLNTTDETRLLTQSGQVYLRVPGQIPAIAYRDLGYPALEDEPEDTDAEPPLYYWLQVRQRSGTYARPPKIDRILTNTIRATAARTVFDEAVGSSDGTPNQSMTLRHSPVLADPPLHLEVDEGDGSKPWTAVIDFFGSGPGDAHYVLNRNTGEIRFGDGRRGRIPVAGQFNIIARQYRYGGGQIGNVGARTITDLSTPVPAVDEVLNYRAAVGGMDEEPLNDTMLRAPQELKSRERAVTLEDFQLLAKETPGALVARSVAYVSAPERNVIQVVIVPQSRAAKPVPHEETRRLVCRYLNERRLVTTQVKVRSPLYHDIDINLAVRATTDADLRTVTTAIRDRLTDYLHPLRGGAAGNGWPFGRSVYYSELLREVMLLPGVSRVVELDLLKLLPRRASTGGDPLDPPFFDRQPTPSEAAALLQFEQDAFPDGCTPTAATIQVAGPGESEDAPPQSQFYVAARYRCCDLPVAAGALVAVRRVTVQIDYERGGDT